MHSIFYVSLLHLHLPSKTQQGLFDPIVASENQQYEIKRIMTHKKPRVKTVYQVRFRGYDAPEDSWLRGKDLANAFDLLLAYQLRHGL